MKFFRKIRRGLANDNEFIKYSRYAFGEIVLVVIGILIALQINTWSENRQLMKEELKVLKGLHNEMSDNLIQFDNTFSNHLIKTENLKKTLLSDLENYTLAEFDDLEINIIDSWTYNPSFSIYNTLVSSGKIELISNDLLKYKISNYKDLVNDYLEGEFVARTNTRDHNWNYLIGQSSISAKSEQEIVKDRSHYLREFQSHQFQNAITLLSLNMKIIISEGSTVREETLGLIDMLAKKIEKLDN